LTELKVCIMSFSQRLYGVSPGLQEMMRLPQSVKPPKAAKVIVKPKRQTSRKRRAGQLKVDVNRLTAGGQRLAGKGTRER
jgi:hypothetical protein